MRELFTEDGDKVEVPTEEELKELKEAQEKLKGQDGITKELEEANAKLEDYENNPLQKNIKLVRTIKDNLTKKLKEQGKEVEVDETTGNVTLKTEAKMTQEDLDDRSKIIARQELLNIEKSKVFGKYDEEKRKVVEHYYDKLSAGEDMSIDNLNKFVSEAEKLAGVEAPKGTTPGVNGQPPVFEGKGQNFGDTEEGKEMANEIFGEDSYANQSKE